MTSTDMTTKRLSDRPLESCTELSTEKQFNIILDRLARLTQLQLETQAQISQLAPGKVVLSPEQFTVQPDPSEQHLQASAQPKSPSVNGGPGFRSAEHFRGERFEELRSARVSSGKKFDDLQAGEKSTHNEDLGTLSSILRGTVVEENDEEKEDEEEEFQVVCELHPMWNKHQEKVLPLKHCGTTVAAVDVFQTSAHRDAMRRSSSSNVPLDVFRVHSVRKTKKKKTSFRSRCSACLNNMMLSPSSTELLIWSIMEGYLLLYDVITIPASVLEPPTSKYDSTMKYISVIFWTVDMPACCFKGSISHSGDLEMRFNKVAKGYLKRNFLVDLVLVVIEYVNFLMWHLEQGAELAKMGRFMRILRFSRLLKVGKMRRLFRRFMGHVSSPAKLTVVYTLGELIGIVLLCHAGACAWYAIGENHMETLPLGASGMDVDRRWILHESDTNFWYRYSTSLQWAIAQLGYGGIDIYPTNTGERVFACVFTLVCMVTLCLWIANLVASLIRLQQLKESNQAETDKLRDYLRMHRVSLNLRNRVWKVLRHVPEDDTMLLEQDVEYCKELPKPLALELRAEVYIPILTLHPFFGTYGVSNADKHCMARLLRGHALQQARLELDENLFFPGDFGLQMYFTITGCVEYQCNGTYQEIGSKAWLSEASLWLKWCHNGRATAFKRCKLVTLEADEFRLTMSLLPEAQRYAKVFYNFAMINTNMLCDIFPEPEKSIQIADDIFAPPTSFRIAHTHPTQSEWEPSLQDWKLIWRSTWTPSNLLSSAAMIMTLTSEMKNDVVLVYQTIFAQNLPVQQPFHWTSAEEREAFDLRVLFLKRYMLLLAVCKVQFSEEDNGQALRPWPFPLASAICHGGRIMLELYGVSWKDLLTYLLLGKEAASQESGVPSPFYTRRAATHGVVMERDTLMLREVKLSGPATLSSHNLGMDMPVGGLGNPLPSHQRQGELLVGPAGVPYKKKDNNLDMEAKGSRHPSTESTAVKSATVNDVASNYLHYIWSLQQGHFYVRFDDFGFNITRRLYPSRRRALACGSVDSFDMTLNRPASGLDTHPSICFNKISLAQRDWTYVNAQKFGGLMNLLRRYGLSEAAGNDDKVNRLKHLLFEQELVMEVKRNSSEELRCRGNMLHVVFKLSDGRESKVLVQTAATGSKSNNSKIARTTQRGSTSGESTDVRVPTIICRHNELWTSALSRYCKTVFGLSEPAVAHVVKSCDERATLYMTAPAPSVCFRHVNACSAGVPLDYEVLQLTVHIDSQSRSLFEPLFNSGASGNLRTIETNVDIQGFAHLTGSGSICREWQWMTEDELSVMSIKIKGLQAPNNAAHLDVKKEEVLVNSLLMGIESSAPLKEDVFGEVHGMNAKTKELSAFGKRKWRDFRTGVHAMPADLGGMRAIVDEEKFAELKRVCSDLLLCKPSESFTDDTAPKKELEVFQQLLRSHDFVPESARNEKI